MRRAATFGLDKQVKECADLLGEKHILTKLAAVHMITIDAAYHQAYLTKLYRKAATVGRYDTERNKTQVIRAHVLN